MSIFSCIFLYYFYAVRIIIGDEPITIDESTIDALLKIEPIYSSSVAGVNSTLRFDVIKLGGNTNA